MMWRMAELIELKDTGKRDKLGNHIKERVVLGTARVRACPVGVLATPDEGNDYKAGDLTLITITPLKTALRASLVRFPITEPSNVYEVIQVSELGRRRVLTLRLQKGSVS